MYPNLNAEMARKGFTVKTLADELGISDTSLANKLNGKKDFWFSEVMHLKRVFGCPIDYLFSDSPIPPT